MKILLKTLDLHYLFPRRHANGAWHLDKVPLPKALTLPHSHPRIPKKKHKGKQRFGKEVFAHLRTKHRSRSTPRKIIRTEMAVGRP